MKKTLFTLTSILLLTACSNTDEPKKEGSSTTIINYEEINSEVSYSGDDFEANMYSVEPKKVNDSKKEKDIFISDLKSNNSIHLHIELNEIEYLLKNGSPLKEQKNGIDFDYLIVIDNIEYNISINHSNFEAIVKSKEGFFITSSENGLKLFNFLDNAM